MSIFIHKNTAGKVKGLTRALRLMSRDGHYYGSELSVVCACASANSGDYSEARGILRKARERGRSSVRGSEHIS